MQDESERRKGKRTMARNEGREEEGRKTRAGVQIPTHSGQATIMNQPRTPFPFETIVNTVCSKRPTSEDNTFENNDASRLWDRNNALLRISSKFLDNNRDILRFVSVYLINNFEKSL
ncbi:hypothetical protein V1478_012481 [Vespula squamosa]|uniref:Uncharacterized protein n=1 Tax=Vespula squamosa TaxID=30214 RepID=A0ABD2ADK4_VESSQ